MKPTTKKTTKKSRPKQVTFKIPVKGEVHSIPGIGNMTTAAAFGKLTGLPFDPRYPGTGEKLRRLADRLYSMGDNLDKSLRDIREQIEKL